jgi:hypothetical protein
VANAEQRTYTQPRSLTLHRIYRWYVPINYNLHLTTDINSDLSNTSFLTTTSTLYPHLKKLARLLFLKSGVYLRQVSDQDKWPNKDSRPEENAFEIGPISIYIRKGSVVSILGESGSGKRFILKLTSSTLVSGHIGDLSSQTGNVLILFHLDFCQWNHCLLSSGTVYNFRNNQKQHLDGS